MVAAPRCIGCATSYAHGRVVMAPDMHLPDAIVSVSASRSCSLSNGDWERGEGPGAARECFSPGRTEPLP